MKLHELQIVNKLSLPFLPRGNKRHKSGSVCYLNIITPAAVLSSLASTRPPLPESMNE